MAKEGKVFDKKNHCSLSCIPMREQKWVVLFLFTSSTMAVYSNGEPSLWIVRILQGPLVNLWEQILKAD